MLIEARLEICSVESSAAYFLLTELSFFFPNFISSFSHDCHRFTPFSALLPNSISRDDKIAGVTYKAHGCPEFLQQYMFNRNPCTLCGQPLHQQEHCQTRTQDITPCVDCGQRSCFFPGSSRCNKNQANQARKNSKSTPSLEPPSGRNLAQQMLQFNKRVEDQRNRTVSRSISSTTNKSSSVLNGAASVGGSISNGTLVSSQNCSDPMNASFASVVSSTSINNVPIKLTGTASSNSVLRRDSNMAPAENASCTNSSGIEVTNSFQVFSDDLPDPNAELFETPPVTDMDVDDELAEAFLPPPVTPVLASYSAELQKNTNAGPLFQTIVDCGGSGDCLTKVLSRHIYGFTKYHANVRSTIASFIRKSRDRFESWYRLELTSRRLTSVDFSYGAWVDTIATPGTFSSHAELVAATLLFQRCCLIEVVSGDPKIIEKQNSTHFFYGHTVLPNQALLQTPVHSFCRISHFHEHFQLWVIKPCFPKASVALTKQFMANIPKIIPTLDIQDTSLNFLNDFQDNNGNLITSSDLSTIQEQIEHNGPAVTSKNNDKNMMLHDADGKLLDATLPDSNACFPSLKPNKSASSVKIVDPLGPKKVHSLIPVVRKAVSVKKSSFNCVRLSPTRLSISGDSSQVSNPIDTSTKIVTQLPSFIPLVKSNQDSHRIGMVQEVTSKKIGGSNTGFSSQNSLTEIAASGTNNGHSQQDISADIVRLELTKSILQFKDKVSREKIEDQSLVNNNQGSVSQQVVIQNLRAQILQLQNPQNSHNVRTPNLNFNPDFRFVETNCKTGSSAYGHSERDSGSERDAMVENIRNRQRKSDKHSSEVVQGGVNRLSQPMRTSTQLVDFTNSLVPLNMMSASTMSTSVLPSTLPTFTDSGLTGGDLSTLPQFNQASTPPRTNNWYEMQSQNLISASQFNSESILPETVPVNALALPVTVDETVSDGKLGRKRSHTFPAPKDATCAIDLSQPLVPIITPRNRTQRKNARSKLKNNLSGQFTNAHNRSERPLSTPKRRKSTEADLDCHASTLFVAESNPNKKIGIESDGVAENVTFTEINEVLTADLLNDPLMNNSDKDPQTDVLPCSPASVLNSGSVYRMFKLINSMFESIISDFLEFNTVNSAFDFLPYFSEKNVVHHPLFCQFFHDIMVLERSSITLTHHSPLTPKTWRTVLIGLSPVRSLDLNLTLPDLSPSLHLRIQPLRIQFSRVQQLCLETSKQYIFLGYQKIKNVYELTTAYFFLLFFVVDHRIELSRKINRITEIKKIEVSIELQKITLQKTEITIEMKKRITLYEIIHTKLCSSLFTQCRFVFVFLPIFSSIIIKTPFFRFPCYTVHESPFFYELCSKSSSLFSSLIICTNFLFLSPTIHVFQKNFFGAIHLLQCLTVFVFLTVDVLVSFMSLSPSLDFSLFLYPYVKNDFCIRLSSIFVCFRAVIDTCFAFYSCCYLFFFMNKLNYFGEEPYFLNYVRFFCCYYFFYADFCSFRDLFYMIYIAIRGNFPIADVLNDLKRQIYRHLQHYPREVCMASIDEIGNLNVQRWSKDWRFFQTRFTVLAIPHCSYVFHFFNIHGLNYKNRPFSLIDDLHAEYQTKANTGYILCVFFSYICVETSFLYFSHFMFSHKACPSCDPTFSSPGCYSCTIFTAVDHDSFSRTQYFQWHAESRSERWHTWRFTGAAIFAAPNSNQLHSMSRWNCKFSNDKSVNNLYQPVHNFLLCSILCAVFILKQIHVKIPRLNIQILDKIITFNQLSCHYFSRICFRNSVYFDMRFSSRKLARYVTYVISKARIICKNKSVMNGLKRCSTHSTFRSIDFDCRFPFKRFSELLVKQIKHSAFYIFKHQTNFALKSSLFNSCRILGNSLFCKSVTFSIDFPLNLTPTSKVLSTIIDFYRLRSRLSDKKLSSRSFSRHSVANNLNRMVFTTTLNKSTPVQPNHHDLLISLPCFITIYTFTLENTLHCAYDFFVTKCTVTPVGKPEEPNIVEHSRIFLQRATLPLLSTQIHTRDSLIYFDIRANGRYRECVMFICFLGCFFYKQQEHIFLLVATLFTRNLSSHFPLSFSEYYCLMLPTITIANFLSRRLNNSYTTYSNVNKQELQMLSGNLCSAVTIHVIQLESNFLKDKLNNLVSVLGLLSVPLSDLVINISRDELTFVAKLDQLLCNSTCNTPIRFFQKRSGLLRGDPLLQKTMLCSSSIFNMSETDTNLSFISILFPVATWVHDSFNFFSFLRSNCSIFYSEMVVYSSSSNIDGKYFISFVIVFDSDLKLDVISLNFSRSGAMANFNHDGKRISFFYCSNKSARIAYNAAGDRVITLKCYSLQFFDVEFISAKVQKKLFFQPIFGYHYANYNTFVLFKFSAPLLFSSLFFLHFFQPRLCECLGCIFLRLSVFRHSIMNIPLSSTPIQSQKNNGLKCLSISTIVHDDSLLPEIMNAKQQISNARISFSSVNTPLRVSKHDRSLIERFATFKIDDYRLDKGCTKSVFTKRDLCDVHNIIEHLDFVLCCISNGRDYVHNKTIKVLSANEECLVFHTLGPFYKNIVLLNTSFNPDLVYIATVRLNAPKISSFDRIVAANFESFSVFPLLSSEFTGNNFVFKVNNSIKCNHDLIHRVAESEFFCDINVLASRDISTLRLCYRLIGNVNSIHPLTQAVIFLVQTNQVVLNVLEIYRMCTRFSVVSPFTIYGIDIIKPCDGEKLTKIAVKSHSEIALFRFFVFCQIERTDSTKIVLNKQVTNVAVDFSRITIQCCESVWFTECCIIFVFFSLNNHTLPLSLLCAENAPRRKRTSRSLTHRSRFFFFIFNVDPIQFVFIFLVHYSDTSFFSFTISLFYTTLNFNKFDNSFLTILKCFFKLYCHKESSVLAFFIRWLSPREYNSFLCTCSKKFMFVMFMILVFVLNLCHPLFRTKPHFNMDRFGISDGKDCYLVALGYLQQHLALGLKTTVTLLDLSNCTITSDQHRQFNELGKSYVLIANKLLDLADEVRLSSKIEIIPAHDTLLLLSGDVKVGVLRALNVQCGWNTDTFFEFFLVMIFFLCDHIFWLTFFDFSQEKFDIVDTFSTADYSMTISTIFTGFTRHLRSQIYHLRRLTSQIPQMIMKYDSLFVYFFQSVLRKLFFILKSFYKICLFLSLSYFYDRETHSSQFSDYGYSFTQIFSFSSDKKTNIDTVKILTKHRFFSDNFSRIIDFLVQQQFSWLSIYLLLFRCNRLCTLLNKISSFKCLIFVIFHDIRVFFMMSLSVCVFIFRPTTVRRSISQNASSSQKHDPVSPISHSHISRRPSSIQIRVDASRLHSLPSYFKGKRRFSLRTKADRSLYMIFKDKLENILFFNPAGEIIRKHEVIYCDSTLVACPYNSFGACLAVSPSKTTDNNVPLSGSNSDPELDSFLTDHSVHFSNDSNERRESVHELISKPLDLNEFDDEFMDELRKDDNLFSIVVLNTNGRVSSNSNSYSHNVFCKNLAIRSVFARDSLLMFSETNMFSHDAVNMQRAFAPSGDTRITDCSHITYSNNPHRRVVKNQGAKVSGFGTTIIDKSNIGTWIDGTTSNNSAGMQFEILARVVNVGHSVQGLCLTFYRSPSMKCTLEINLFYETIFNIVSQTRNKHPNLNFILCSGDDNSSSASVASLSKNTFINKLRLSDGLGSKMTRFDKRNMKEYQPDSLFFWHDIVFARLEIEVLPKLYDTIDHYPLRITVICDGIVPRLPTYRYVERHKRCKTDDEIADFFQTRSTQFSEIFLPFIDSRDQIGHLHPSLPASIHEQTVETAAVQLQAIFDDVFKFGWKTIVSTVSDNVKNTDNEFEVKFAQKFSKIQKLKFKLMTISDPKKLERLTAIISAEYIILNELLADSADNILQLDMKFQNNSDRELNSRRFQREAKRILNKRQGCYDESISMKRTPEQEASDLKKHDATFHCDDPVFIENYDNYMKEAASVAECTLGDDGLPLSYTDFIDDWDPRNYPEHLPQLINSMKKVDKVFRLHRHILAEPIFILCKLMSLTHYWPLILRTSKMTFIPGRSIFSLKPLNKIIEGVQTDCLTRCRDIKIRISGRDPLACAYFRDRGTESCNLISYTVAERDMREHKLPVIQIAADLQKAFNKAHRPRIVSEMQVASQSGSLVVSRFDGRWYEYNGQKRGVGPELPANRGTDAGSTVAVFEFSAFMDTDCFFSNFNEYVLWASYYSDDRCPIISGRHIGDVVGDACGAEKTLIGTWNWSQQHGVSYHMSGKKACELIILKMKDCKSELFPKKLVTYDVSDASGSIIKKSKLSLGGQDITVVEKMTVLGLTIASTPFATIFSDPQKQKIHLKQAQRNIQKFGYLFDITLKDYKFTAYRIRDFLRTNYTPRKIRELVSSYLGGRIRFCSSLHWARATVKQIETVRFYYIFACSAILGLNAFTTMGASCCFKQSTTFTNDVKKVLQLTDLPSIIEMTANNAKSVITQVRGMRPDFFAGGTKRERGVENKRFDTFVLSRLHYREQWRDDRVLNLQGEYAQSKHFIPRRVSSDFIGTLVDDVHKLALLDVDELKASRFVDGLLNMHDIQRVTDESWNANDNNVQNNIREFTFKTEMFRTFCKQELDCLEARERRRKCKTPTYKDLRSLPLVCSTRPPDFFSDIVDPQPPLSCDSTWDTPSGNNEILAVTESSHGQCRACGVHVTYRTIKQRTNSNFFRCSDCEGIVHISCLGTLKVNTLSFTCKDLRRRLTPEGKEFSTAYKSVPLTRTLCLVCGHLLDGKFSDRALYLSSKLVHDSEFISAQTIWCNQRCLHGVHLSCLTVHDLYKRLKAGRPFDNFAELNYNIQHFTCDIVDSYFSVNKIDNYFHSLSTLFSGRHVPEPLTPLSEIETINPTKTRTRYHDNLGDYECQTCDQLVPHEELDHELYNCPAMPSQTGFTCSRLDPIVYRRKALNQLTQLILIKQAKTFSWDPGIRNNVVGSGSKKVMWDPGI